MCRRIIYLVVFVFLLAPVGSVNGAEGLLGEYYERDTANPWQVLLMKRLDPMVDFNWGDNSPDPSVPVDNFMIRWTGEVEVPVSATYTFHTQTDDGIRLWVNNEQLIDNWTDHGSTHDSGDIALAVGQRYEITLEFYENGGGAQCQLSWSTPTIPREPIPSQYLWVGGDRPNPRHPNPADGAIIRDTWVSLAWSPGDYAASHSIYIGENPDEVRAGTGDTFKINQTDTAYAVGFTGYPYPDGLAKGMTYYWRIEDIQADGTTTHSGPVWSFSTAPRTAYNPNPADGEESVDPNEILEWVPGLGAVLHTVFFSEDYDTVNDAVAGIPQGALTYTPGTLDSAKTYYWRVDEFFGFETLKGEIWSFSTPGAVGGPNPYHGAENVKQTPILRWVANDNAGSHQVYFGTDKDAVRNATTASPEYKGPKSLGDEKYDPGQLEQSTAYYWRIDEVNNLNPNSPWKGGVWTFTTADFLVVDDLESYNDIDPPNPGSNTIFGYWIDGYQTATNSALVGNDFPPYTEQTVIHGGRQSMPYVYDITMKFAEATLTLDSPRDWTAADVKTLTIWFHGNLVNDAAQIYVAIANITGAPAVVTHNDPAATQIHAWTRWDIPLQAFADKGIDLTDVNTITIGIGDKANPSGGKGKIYFDDIGLHPLGAEPDPAP
ncbi:MAG: PA14 domain-containing protein [Planctomycetota bacterium]